MKLLPTSTRVPRDDAFGRGMDAAITLAIFVGIGYLVDRWLGTTPVFMIVLVLLASVGLFLKLKYSYEASMREQEAARDAGRGAGRTR
jgi:F0F1-type ATP synthase assembly protein I